jgi:hypothetical protein
MANVTVNDMAIMVRSMAGDVASKAADKLQPTEDQMSQIDAPAEDNTWHEPPKNPELSRQKIQEQLKTIRGRAPWKKGVKDGSIDDGAVAVQNQTGVTNADPATGIQVPSKTEKNAKTKLKQYQERSQNYLTRKMPKERREQTIWRLKKMIVEIQGHADCTSGLLVCYGC